MCPRAQNSSPRSHVNTETHRRGHTSPWYEDTLAYGKNLYTENQVITPDVLPDDMLAFMQNRTMVPVNNLDETRVKPEQCLRTPLDETKMEHYHDQQMAVLSTPKPLASSNDHVGTREPPKNQLSSLLSIIVNPSFPGSRRKDHSNHVRRSIELLDPISLKNLQLEIFKQSHDAVTEFKPIVQEGQQCLDLAADVSDLGDEIMEFVQQLTVMNQPNRQPMLYELELLNRFIQQLQYEQLRRSSARM